MSAQPKPRRSAAYRAAYARGREIAEGERASFAEARLERLLAEAVAADNQDAEEAYQSWLDWIRGDTD